MKKASAPAEKSGLNNISREAKGILDFLLELSYVRATQHCSGFDFKLAEIEHHEVEEFHGEERCLILLLGSQCSLAFNTYYNLKTAQALAAHAQGLNDKNATPEVARAFMTEFNNLVAGFFRGVFEENRILFEMSLPIPLPGEDKTCYLRTRQEKTFARCWKLINEQGHNIICSCELQLDKVIFYGDIEAKIWSALEIERNKSESDLTEFY